MLACCTIPHVLIYMLKVPLLKNKYQHIMNSKRLFNKTLDGGFEKTWIFNDTSSFINTGDLPIQFELCEDFICYCKLCFCSLCSSLI